MHVNIDSLNSHGITPNLIVCISDVGSMVFALSSLILNLIIWAGLLIMNCLIIHTLRYRTSEHTNNVQDKHENRAHCQSDNYGFKGDSSRHSCVETGLSGEEIHLNVVNLEKGTSSQSIMKKQQPLGHSKQGWSASIIICHWSKWIKDRFRNGMTKIGQFLDIHITGRMY